MRLPLSLDSLAASHPHVSWQALLPAAAHLAGPEQVLEEAEQSRRIREAIESLPAPHKDVLALHYLQGLTYAEIAAD